jgi:dTDP-4-dehydrorhamnose reductase
VKRVLILGGAGMLGHKLWQRFQQEFDTWVTLRGGLQQYAGYELFDRLKTIEHFDATDFDRVIHVVADIHPDVIVNAAGIIKQSPLAKLPLDSLAINAMLPHRLADLCRLARIRFVHVGTDCVFTGRRGMYVESDVADAEDLYGRTKFLGEVGSPGCLTLRTSLIGRELVHRRGLVEWFLSNRGLAVPGYQNVFFSGLTTIAFADLLTEVITRHEDLAGTYHVAAARVSKLDLLGMLRTAFRLDVKIVPQSEPALDRSLNGVRFQTATGISVPEWPSMIETFAADQTPYEYGRTC